MIRRIFTILLISMMAMPVSALSVRKVKKGTTNVEVQLRIIDSTDGTPETGVVWNTAGIDLEYRRDGAVSTDITEATLAALTTAHTDGGFLHIGNGHYRLDLPDAACASGVDRVLIHGTVTGMVVIGCEIELVDYDPYDSVRLGLTALPNAAADAAGGLAISDAGGLDLDAMNTNINDIETDTNSLNDTKIPDTISLANINTEVDTGITDAKLDHLVAVADADDPVNGSIIAELASTTGDWSTFVTTTEALQALRDHIADGTNLTEAGGTGDHLTAVPYNSAWDADIESEVTDALEADHLDHLFAVSVADEIVNDSFAADLVSSTGDWSTFVKGDDSLQALEGKITTVDTVADGIQTDLDNATDGLGALKSLIDTVDTVADGIQTDLDNGTDGLGALKALIDIIDGIVDSILVDTGTTLDSAITTIDGNVDDIKDIVQTQ